MISVLVLTDDVSTWANKFQNCLSALHEHKTEDDCYLENPMFKVNIKKMLRGLEKEKRYTHIIVDKYISKGYEEEVLRPKISNPVIYERGYFKDWQERAILEQQKGYNLDQLPHT